MAELLSRRQALAGGIGLAAAVAGATSLSPNAFADIPMWVDPRELP